MHTIMQSTAAPAQMLQMSTARAAARQMMQMSTSASSSSQSDAASGCRAQAGRVVLQAALQMLQTGQLMMVMLVMMEMAAGAADQVQIVGVAVVVGDDAAAGADLRLARFRRQAHNQVDAIQVGQQAAV